MSIEVEQWPIDRLKPFERNARTHSAEQVGQIAASIQQWGWTFPILAEESGRVVAGHGRLLAAQLLELPEVPVIVARGWSDAKVRAYIIADNKLALNAGWDFSTLALELQELDTGDFDMTLIGFSEAELEQIATWTPPETPTGEAAAAPGTSSAGRLSERFMLPPFSTLNAREGWWQDRKARWIALGIRSEVGRSAPAGGNEWPAGELGPDGKFERRDMHAGKNSPGGSPRPAADYSKSGARGDGKGTAFPKSGAVVDPGAKGGMVAGLLRIRAAEKAS